MYEQAIFFVNSILIWKNFRKIYKNIKFFHHFILFHDITNIMHSMSFFTVGN